MNECDLDKICVKRDNGFTMLNKMNIKFPCDVGISYGFFTPTLPHITLSFQLPNLYTINQKLGVILRNTTHNFRQQGYTSYYNINQDTIQCLIYSNLLQHFFLVHPSKNDVSPSKSQLENLPCTMSGQQYCMMSRNLSYLSQVHQTIHYNLELQK